MASWGSHSWNVNAAKAKAVNNKISSNWCSVQEQALIGWITAHQTSLFVSIRCKQTASFMRGGEQCTAIHFSLRRIIYDDFTDTVSQVKNLQTNQPTNQTINHPHSRSISQYLSGSKCKINVVKKRSGLPIAQDDIHKYPILLTTKDSEWQWDSDCHREHPSSTGRNKKTPTHLSKKNSNQNFLFILNEL